MDYTKCTIWEPSIKTPKIPLVEINSTFIPLYPVFMTRFSPSSYRRGWFWVYECTKCGKERLMSRGFTVYNECTCVAHRQVTRVPIFPREEHALCSGCGKDFVYTKLAGTHFIKYCGNECTALAKSTFQKNWSVEHKKLSVIEGFNRVKICMRYDGVSYALCDHYHVCLTFRIDGDLGPHYIEGGGCYIFSGKNIV